jgi:hypothetical protein
MDKFVLQKIKYRVAEYIRLKSDGRYTEVELNARTGGLLAIHREHNFDPTIGEFGIPRGDYERIAANVLYGYGKSVVLESEHLGKDVKSAEGLLDGKKFDIKGVEGTGKNNLQKDFKSAGKKKVETIVFYFHENEIFDLQRIKEDYAHYLRNSKSKTINTVYYITCGKLYAL